MNNQVTNILKQDHLSPEEINWLLTKVSNPEKILAKIPDTLSIPASVALRKIRSYDNILDFLLKKGKKVSITNLDADPQIYLTYLKNKQYDRDYYKFLPFNYLTIKCPFAPDETILDLIVANNPYLLFTFPSAELNKLTIAGMSFWEYVIKNDLNIPQALINNPLVLKLIVQYHKFTYLTKITTLDFIEILTLTMPEIESILTHCPHIKIVISDDFMLDKATYEQLFGVLLKLHRYDDIVQNYFSSFMCSLNSNKETFIHQMVAEAQKSNTLNELKNSLNDADLDDNYRFELAREEIYVAFYRETDLVGPTFELQGPIKEVELLNFDYSFSQGATSDATALKIVRQKMRDLLIRNETLAHRYLRALGDFKKNNPEFHFALGSDGYFSPHDNLIMITVEDSCEAIIHEITHALHITKMKRQFPLAIKEAMANLNLTDIKFYREFFANLSRKAVTDETFLKNVRAHMIATILDYYETEENYKQSIMQEFTQVLGTTEGVLRYIDYHFKDMNNLAKDVVESLIKSCQGDYTFDEPKVKNSYLLAKIRNDYENYREEYFMAYNDALTYFEDFVDAIFKGQLFENKEGSTNSILPLYGHGEEYFNGLKDPLYHNPVLQNVDFEEMLADYAALTASEVGSQYLAKLEAFFGPELMQNMAEFNALLLEEPNQKKQINLKNC